MFEAEVLRDGPETPADAGVRLSIVHIGPDSELNVFEIDGNTEAERQTPMFARGRIDHLAYQAQSLEAFETIRERLVARGAADRFVTDFGQVLSVFFRDPDGLECEVCVANPDARRGCEPTRYARSPLSRSAVTPPPGSRGSGRQGPVGAQTHTAPRHAGPHLAGDLSLSTQRTRRTSPALSAVR